MIPTSIYVLLGQGKMAAVLRAEDKYYYQIVGMSCLGIEKKEIIVEQCVGPFEDFVTVNNEIDKLKR